MTRAPALCGFVLLLAGCGQQEVPSVDALSADPSRLHLLKKQCRVGQHGGALCAQVAQADLRRFFSGKAGPDAYRTLADLPPIPASFDEPADDGQALAVALPGQEDSP
ncbi:MAG: hypothetical protein KDF67_01935 [Ottowia sp.]|jgi:hypothetical protein|uniref:hypothetical protein n=1 Tax=Ottowia sp. TaxID=1898956 RepID=UPI001D3BBC30|nr:hypothetical protein [Ottowia sp.]MCB2031902.1 hypothetical protein [Ottowia sp.]MCB2037088.1 hypothetical protein [Ottowia sp.]MCB2068479.1 hypothetical protein [Ottowia sp.]